MPESPEDILMMNMIGAAPEREDEIRSLWQQYHPSVVLSDSGKFRLDANRQTITIDVKTPDVFWLIGFSGWRAIETYVPSVMTAAMTNMPVAEVRGVEGSESPTSDQEAGIGADEPPRAVQAPPEPSAPSGEPDVPPPDQPAPPALDVDTAFRRARERDNAARFADLARRNTERW